MSKETWWAIAPESPFTFEQRPNGDLVVANRDGAEEHVLHGYEWMHITPDDPQRIKVHGEGPPPFGRWVRLD
ncbi:maltose regulon activator MalT [Rhodococcus sp. NPDC058505]|uniref:maltose regulon activator MalT n=1 Tax=unclassified Rhodococcus (in: high G+C Gram-positive bacteria) TaxID=192944 RepID=UPI00366970C9